MARVTVDRGDLIWIDLDPQAGSEQKGRRPALVISPRAYNAKSRFVVICPVTNQAKGWPFEVALPAGGPITGVVLTDQVKSLDGEIRQVKLAGRVPPQVMHEVLARLAPLVS